VSQILAEKSQGEPRISGKTIALIEKMAKENQCGEQSGFVEN
jgi:hypothetical protein